MTVGKGDPNYGAALEAVRRALAAVSGTDPATGQPYAPEYAGLPAELAALQARLLERRRGSEKSASWISSAAVQLEAAGDGADQLSERRQQDLRRRQATLAAANRSAWRRCGSGDGLARLGDGATALAAGLARLTGGTEPSSRASPRATGAPIRCRPALRRSQRPDRLQATRSNAGPAALRRTPPGSSTPATSCSRRSTGPPPQRRRLPKGSTSNSGGQAATLLVFSRFALNSPGSIAFHKRLDADADALGREAGVDAGVAGGPADPQRLQPGDQGADPARRRRDHPRDLPRPGPDPALAAAGGDRGRPQPGHGRRRLRHPHVLLDVPDGWPLGGHTYVDSVGATMIFGIVFGLSIDYAVFLLVRMREHYDREGDNRAAIMFGLEKTARVITGAAAIMMAVFVVFAGAPIATVSQLGIGLTVAVLLDATVVRIVLLPALMLLIGDRVWWLPRWLDRVLPRLNV